MKHAVLLVLLSAFAVGQTQKYQFAEKPIKDGPFVHLTDEPVQIFVHKNTVPASGVWVADGKSSPRAGPSVSQIYCDGHDNTCHEQIANIVPVGESFSLTPDSADYRVTRWNEREIVAENRNAQAPLIAGSCHLLGVLKIDLVHKKVYAYQTLSEPTDNDQPELSKGVCEAANNTTWELRHETTFFFSSDAKTVFSEGQQQSAGHPKH